MSNLDINKAAPSGLQERPLVTLALFAYNQDKYIREAVEGALAQTYSPLEIILSDDRSSDKTYEIIKEMVQDYCGPHVIKVRRSEKNRGFAQHINEVLSEAKGSFVVMAAGDDISERNRVSRLVEERCKYPALPCCLYSDFSTMDASSKTIRGGNCHVDFSKKNLDDFVKQPFALVCSYAFDIGIFKLFGGLDPQLKNEDFIVPFRTLLLNGKIVYVDEPLVRYRVAEGHAHAEKKMSARNKLLNCYQRRAALHNQLISDLAASEHTNRFLSSIQKRHKALLNIIEILADGSFKKYLLIIKSFFNDPVITLEAYKRWIKETSPVLQKIWGLIKKNNSATS